MAANIIIRTFLMWFTQGKYAFLGIIAMTVMIINGCATTPKKSFLYIPPQSEIERFEGATALSYSEIPEVYDISHLRVGSMAKFRVKYKNVVMGRPYYAVYTVRGITSDPPEKKFIFDNEAYGRRDTTFSHSYVKGLTYTYEATGDYLTRVFVSDRVKQVNVTSPPSQVPDMGGLATAALAGGALGVGLETLRQKTIRDQEPVNQEYAQFLKEKNLVADRKTKVVQFNLISHEEVTIANKRIFCKVYEIKTICKKMMHYFASKGSPYFGQNIPSTPYIEYNSIKIWVSNDVPFGIVKKEVQIIAHYSSDREPTKYSQHIELEEFEY